MNKKWIAILGSPRRGRNTEKLIDYYIEGLESHGIEVEKIALSEIKQNPCTGCCHCLQNNICFYKDDISDIIDKIKRAEGLILGSPSYNYNVTPYMKIFLDRLYSLFTFGKGTWSSELDSKELKSILIGVCAGYDDYSMGFTIEAMKRVMIDHKIQVIIEENYFGTRRNPVERNEEIKDNIMKKLQNFESVLNKEGTRITN